MFAIFVTTKRCVNRGWKENVILCDFEVQLPFNTELEKSALGVEKLHFLLPICKSSK